MDMGPAPADAHPRWQHGTYLVSRASYLEASWRPGGASLVKVPLPPCPVPPYAFALLRDLRG